MSVSRKRQLTVCGIRPRAWTELVEGMPNMRIRFNYPCGYSTIIVIADDKKLSRIAPALMLRWAHSYWSKPGGGVSDECPKCRRAQAKLIREGKRR